MIYFKKKQVVGIVPISSESKIGYRRKKMNAKRIELDEDLKKQVDLAVAGLGPVPPLMNLIVAMIQLQQKIQYPPIKTAPDLTALLDQSDQENE